MFRGFAGKTAPKLTYFLLWAIFGVLAPMLAVLSAHADVVTHTPTPSPVALPAPVDIGDEVQLGPKRSAAGKPATAEVAEARAREILEKGSGDPEEIRKAIEALEPYSANLFQPKESSEEPISGPVVSTDATEAGTARTKVTDLKSQLLSKLMDVGVEEKPLGNESAEVPAAEEKIDASQKKAVKAGWDGARFDYPSDWMPRVQRTARWIAARMAGVLHGLRRSVDIHAWREIASSWTEGAGKESALKGRFKFPAKSASLAGAGAFWSEPSVASNPDVLEEAPDPTVLSAIALLTIFTIVTAASIFRKKRGSKKGTT